MFFQKLVHRRRCEALAELHRRGDAQQAADGASRRCSRLVSKRTPRWRSSAASERTTDTGLHGSTGRRTQTSVVRRESKETGLFSETTPS